MVQTADIANNTFILGFGYTGADGTLTTVSPSKNRGDETHLALTAKTSHHSTFITNHSARQSCREKLARTLLIMNSDVSNRKQRCWNNATSLPRQQVGQLQASQTNVARQSTFQFETCEGAGSAAHTSLTKRPRSTHNGTDVTANSVRSTDLPAESHCSDTHKQTSCLTVCG